jgi:hypothetical protein
MSRKRKGEKTTQKFYCPFCQQRLWRLGSSKYYFPSASQNLISANRSCWLEEFYCEEHGKLWMLVSKASDGTLAIASI